MARLTLESPLLLLGFYTMLKLAMDRGKLFPKPINTSMMDLKFSILALINGTTAGSGGKVIFLVCKLFVNGGIVESLIVTIR